MPVNDKPVASPVIKSDVAARRLKVLLPDGSTPNARLLAALSPASDGSAASEPRPEALTLRAEVLPRPVRIDTEVLAAAGGGAARDALAEVALASRALRELRLPGGALVKVSNPDRPEVRPHLVRAWPAADVAAGVAALPPTLAHNLGLAPHLTQLLRVDGEPAESAEVAPENGAPAEPPPHSRVTVQPYAGPEPRSGAASEPATSSASSASGAPSQVDGAEQAALPQPAPLDPGRIHVAREVHVAVVREPISGWMPPKEDGQGGGGALAGDKDAGGDPVAAIQTYFAGGLRVVCEGDLLAVLKPDGESAVAQVLENLTLEVVEQGRGGGGDDGGWEFARFLFFRVTQVLPEGRAIQVVDVGTTTVRMAGTCCAGLPVGVRGYLGPRPPPPSLLGWAPGAGGLPGGWMMPFAGAMLPAWRNLARLAAAPLHPAAAGVDLRLSVLLHGPAGAGKRTAAAAAAAALGAHCTVISCRDIRGEGPVPDKQVAEGLRVAFDVAGRYRPALLVLSDFEVLAPGGDAHAEASAAKLGAVLAAAAAAGGDRAHVAHRPQLFPCPVLLVACAGAAEDVHPALRRCFTHELAVEAPDAAARGALLRGLMGGGGAGLGEDAWEDLARHTAGLLPRDLRSFAADACAGAALAALPPGAVLDREEEEGSTEAQEVVEAPALGEAHLSAALGAARDRMATDIGAPKIPNVAWDDVGGLDDVKAAILDTVELPLKHPELFSGGLRRRSGVLLYGPPGTGKTLLAKAVATECAVNFLSVKGPELINMYVGESERQVREVFARARRARPCVIFFDELDSLAPARGRGSDSGGVMDRVVSQLLAEIDSAQGGSGTDDVFIVGATNRPDLLDPALLRPGRLDKLLYVGVAADPAAQLKVLAALTRKFALGGDVALEAVAAAAPPRLTGADLYALCSDAWMTALKRKVREGEGEGEVVVRQGDFEAAAAALRPSLTAQDIARYEAIRDEYAYGK